MAVKRVYTSVVALLAALWLSSCAVTTAPTEVSSATSESTTDATSDLTSSTSLDDDDDKAEVEVEQFVISNYKRLRADMAVGEGEYLASLATLLAIDDANKEQFYALTKNNFDQLFVSSGTTVKELIANLHEQVTLASI